MVCKEHVIVPIWEKRVIVYPESFPIDVYSVEPVKGLGGLAPLRTLIDKEKKKAEARGAYVIVAVIAHAFYSFDSQSLSTQSMYSYPNFSMSNCMKCFIF